MLEVVKPGFHWHEASGGPKRQFVLSVVAKPGVHRREAGWGPRISKPQSRHSYSCLKRPPVRQLHYILIMLSTKIPTGQRTGQIAPFANDLRPVGHSTISTHAQMKWHNRRIHNQGSDVPGRRKPGERSGVSPPSQMRATRWADTHRSPSYAPGITHGCLSEAGLLRARFR